MNDHLPPTDGLTRAARLLLQRSKEEQPEPVAAFLARHDELREWLEPMLAPPPTEAEEAPTDRPAAATLGPFRLIGEIGRGGMGVVHEAIRGDDPTPLAVKVLAGFQALQPARAERFRREAALATGLAHPGLARVVDHGAVGDTLWLAMEFVAGAPLDAVLQRLAGRDPATLTAEDLGAAVAATAHRPRGATAPALVGFSGSYTAAVVRIGLQLAEALGHLHQAGVIHRDVKPSNVLLGPDGRVVLTDFGLARATADDSLTLTGDFAGTPNYVSPEQAMAKRVAVDHRSDLFSLGSTLYELLTLQKAFPGDSLPAVLGRILSKEPVAPARLHRGLAPDLTAVLQKLLEKDPDRRYAEAAALAADLRAFLAYRPVAAQRASTLTRMVRWTRREPLRATLAVVLMVTVPGAVAGVSYLAARADEIAAGRALRIAEQVADLVDTGYLAAVQENRQAAARHFADALALDPDHAPAALGLVLNTLRTEGPAAALASVDGPLASALTDGLRALLRFGLQRRLGQPAAAAATATLPEPRSADELYVAAALDLGDEGTQQRLERHERAVLASERPRLWLHLHWAIAADEQRDAAAGRRCADSLLAAWPRQPTAIYFASLALRRGDPARAEALVAAALAEHPEDGKLHWAAANVCEARGDLAGAAAALARAAAHLPESPTCHYALGRTRYERGEHAAALPEFVRARDLSPHFVDAWLGVGMTERKLGNLDAAEAAFRHALTLHGSYDEVQFQLGQLLVQRGDRAAGLEQLEAAATTSATDPNKWHHVAFARFTGGDDAGGADALRHAVAIAPGYERGHAVLAMYLQEREPGQPLREALAAWTVALPGSVEGWLQYGRHCLRDDLDASLRDPATATWAAGRVLALTGERHAGGWLLLGEARAALGQRDAAQTALQRALAADPPLPAAELRRAERLLAQSAAAAPNPGDTGR